MLNERSKRAALFLVILAAILGAWSTPVPSGTVLAGPPAAAAAPKKCDSACRAQIKAQRLEELRRLNKTQKRPNVIVIATDDQNVTDMFVMQQTLGLLGGRGATFTNSFVSYPLCCPSRATFLTGQYAHNHGVLSDQQYGLLDSSNTLAVWLRRAKYRTAMVGKYLNGYGVFNRREIPKGWSQWYALTGGTDQKRYRYNLNENGTVRYYKNGARNYVTDVLSSKVNMLLKEWAISPKPFFLYFNPTAPHGERALPFGSTRDPQPAPRHLGLFGDITAPRMPNFDEKDVSDKPDKVQELPRLSDDLLTDIDRRYRGRLESLLSVDEEVKKIVGLVRKYGDKRKTFIIFTSDNGLQLGAHRIMFKNFLYEEGERVPLIIQGPGIPPGVTRPEFVSNIDLAPTIAHITGARPSRVMDGVSLLPLLTGKAGLANRDLLFESFDIPSFGVRRGPYKYNQTNGDRELYNLDTDPYELDNLLYDPPGLQEPSPVDVALADQLAIRLAQLRGCNGATCN